MLQAHGLSSKLTELGYDVEIIDFRQPATENYYRFKWSFPPRINQWFWLRSCRKFVETVHKLSPKTYRSVQEFSIDANQYDALICGSDQIWYTGPVQYYEPMFFLDIPNFKGKRISYAPSVGGGTDFGDFEEQVKNSIRNIDFLSVRDSHTEAVIKKIITAYVTRVVDPVLLYSFSDIVANEPPTNEPYLLVFGNFKGRECDAIKKLADSKGLSNIVSLQYPNSVATQRIPAPSPQEWISYFKHSAYTITSYFHGTVVSIKFQRPFTAIPTPGRRRKVRTLLETLSAEGRYLETVTSPDSLIENSKGPLDWATVSQNLERNVAHSVAFLKQALDS